MIGLKIGGGLRDAIRWFGVHRESVFDWLEIPRDEFGLAFRTIAGRVILQGISGQRLVLPDGKEGPYVRCDHLSDEVQAAMRSLHYKRPAGSDRLSVTNLGCHTCHHRAWDFSTAMANGYAGWKGNQSEVALMMRPARELLWVCHGDNVRDWVSIWKWAGGRFFGDPEPDFPTATGRMIALTTDPIWTKLSRFGVPWRPFEHEDGIGTRSIGRRDALELKVISQPFKQEPITGWWDLAVTDEDAGT